jgi:hypothetical protein
MDKYRVTLTAEERAELEHLVSVGKGAARRLSHARILLLSDTAVGAEHTDDEIVAALGVGICTVGRVRQRLVTAGLETALNPKPQPAAGQGQDQRRHRAAFDPAGLQRPARRALPVDFAAAGR